MTTSSLFSRIVLILGLFLASSVSLLAFPNATWQVVKSDHFTFSYNERTTVFLNSAVQIAEETFTSLNTYFGSDFSKQKIAIVLADEYDEGNGEAFYETPLVRIDCRKTPNFFRGETEWLRTVISHELSHIYSFSVLKSWLLLNTWVEIGDLASLFVPWGGNNYPEWFIEGLAQMGSHHVAADDHDPIRRMLLGDAVRNNYVLDLDAMGRFEGTSRDYELAYNQGFSFLLYLEKSFSYVSIATLCKTAKDQGFETAFFSLYGKTLRELYAAWKESLSTVFPSTPTWSLPATRLVNQENAMDFETASVKNGEFVIANWGNDYERFNLFRRNQANEYIKITGDTGPVLKFDAQNDMIYFTKTTYNGTIGTGIYDIYQLKISNGTFSPVTKGSRCIAFHVRGDALIYARYNNGLTQIISHLSSGVESILFTFPAATAVYSLSIIDQNRILLSLGTGPKVKAALLSNESIQYLWEDTEVLDLAYAGDNKVFLTSTISGSPQLYWSDLGDNSHTWYQLSNAENGVRFLSIDPSNTVPQLIYSEYAKGSFRLYKTNAQFSREHPVSLETSPVAEPAKATEGSQPIFQTSPTQGSIIFYPYPLSIGVFADKNSTPGADPTALWYWQTSAGMEVGSPSGDVVLTTLFWLYGLIYPQQSLPPTFETKIVLDFSLGSVRNTISDQIELLAERGTDGNQYTYSFNDLSLQSALQLDLHSAAALFYSLHTSTETTSHLNNNYFTTHSLGLRWRYNENLSSQFDPAHLGQENSYFNAEAAFKYIQYPADGYFNPAFYFVDPHPMGAFQYSVGYRALSSASTVSFAATSGGLIYLNAVSGSLITPYVLPTLGGSSFFSGYPAQYAPLNTAVWASMELKMNPFVNKLQSTRWYERFNLGLKIVGGWAQYFSYASYSLKNAWPVSAELSFSEYFYVVPNRESEVSLRVAVPLNDFLTQDGEAPIVLPVQFYFDMSF